MKNIIRIWLLFLCIAALSWIALPQNTPASGGNLATSFVSMTQNGTFGVGSFGASNDAILDNLANAGANSVYRTNNFGFQMQFLGGTLLLRVAPTGTAGQNATLTTVMSVNNNNTVTIGPTGNQLKKIAKYTASLSPASVGANTCAEQTFTVTGVAAADVVVAVNKPTSEAGLGIAGQRASAANTVAINFCNVTSSAITPTASETYSFAVLQ